MAGAGPDGATSSDATTNARAIEGDAAVWVDIETLKPWDRNPRFNSGRPVDTVAESLRLWGWGRTLGAWRGRIIWGHTARLAALKLCAMWGEMTDAQRRDALTSRDSDKRWHAQAVHTAETGRVPVRRRDDLSDREAEALAIADNRTNELAQWDMPNALELLGDFDKVEIEAVGWTGEELENLASELLSGDGGGGSGDVEEDEAPEPPKDPITRMGDVWTLGDHLLMCGEAIAVGTIAPVGKIDMVFTDPPYGVDYVGKTADALPVHNDGKAGLQPLLETGFDALLAVCKAGAPWYVCAPPGPNMGLFGTVLSSRELWRQTIIWVKDTFVLGHSDFHYQHEPIFYGWKPGAAHRAPPDRKQTSIWHFDRPKRSESHPTMKPVQLVAHALTMSSTKCARVVDPFAGSGTTLVASEQLERICHSVELSPSYCDVIVERWQNLTGGKATRRAA